MSTNLARFETVVAEAAEAFATDLSYATAMVLAHRKLHRIPARKVAPRVPRPAA